MASIAILLHNHHLRIENLPLSRSPLPITKVNGQFEAVNTALDRVAMLSAMNLSQGREAIINSCLQDFPAEVRDRLKNIELEDEPVVAVLSWTSPQEGDKDPGFAAGVKWAAQELKRQADLICSRPSTDRTFTAQDSIDAAPFVAGTLRDIADQLEFGESH